MHEVLLNLAANARDAMPQGGGLTIEGANVELDEQATRGREDLRPGPYVRLVVRDTGLGMDAETMAHLFEPFFTTKPVGKGTGLGVSSVYGIVKQNGGDITVSSEPGRRTTFTVHLPRITPLEEIPEPVSAPPGMDRGTETILLVEDESGERQLTREMLARIGYTVLTVLCGLADWLEYRIRANRRRGQRTFGPAIDLGSHRKHGLEGVLDGALADSVDDGRHAWFSGRGHVWNCGPAVARLPWTIRDGFARTFGIS